MTKFGYNPYFLQPSPKHLSQIDDLFNHIVKFATYHLYYKEKLEIIELTKEPAINLTSSTLAYDDDC